MAKFQYSPGLPGYGNQGVDGSSGLSGLATYFTPFNGQSGQNSITTRIAANNVLFGTAAPLPGYPGRIYQTGDIIIDVVGAVYKIDLGTVNLYTSIGSTLSSEPFFGFQATITNTGYDRYSNVFSTDRKTVDNVYSTNGGTGYLTWPSEIYIDNASEFPVINFSNVTGLDSASGEDYHPFLLFTSGVDDNNAIAIVKHSDSNEWRFGNLPANGTLSGSAPNLSLDFDTVTIANDLIIGGSLSGSYTGAVNISNNTDASPGYITFAGGATGQQSLKSNTGLKFNAPTSRLTVTGGININADASNFNTPGAITLGTTANAGIYYNASDNLILNNNTADSSIHFQINGITSVIIDASGIHDVYGNSVGINYDNSINQLDASVQRLDASILYVGGLSINYDNSINQLDASVQRLDASILYVGGLVGSMNITGLSTFSGTIDTTNDTAVIYDNSATSNKKIAFSRVVAEYGTWTPTLAFGGSSTGVTYGSQNGHYVRQVLADGKKLMFITVDMIITSKGSASGEMSIAGLPEVGESTVGSQILHFGVTKGLSTFGVTDLQGRLSGVPQTRVTIYTDDGATAVQNTDLTVSTSITFRLSGTYIASA